MAKKCARMLSVVHEDERYGALLLRMTGVNGQDLRCIWEGDTLPSHRQ